MPIPADIPRQPRRELTPTEIEVEVAGIRAGLEMGGLHLGSEAEEAARAVLTGEMTGDEAFERAYEQIRRRHEQ